MSKLRIEGKNGTARIYVDDIEITAAAALMMLIDRPKLPRVWLQVTPSELEMIGDADVVKVARGEDEGWRDD